MQIMIMISKNDFYYKDSMMRMVNCSLEDMRISSTNPDNDEDCVAATAYDDQ